MCIVAMAWQCFTEQTPHLPLVLLSNRDEFFNRPTQPLHQWRHVAGHPHILAGHDQQSGGTWLGLNADNGKWATVLNVRDIRQPVPTQKISRGQLISDYLTSTYRPREFAYSIDLSRYDGFNLIVGDRQQAFILSNRGQALQSLPAGLHVFSNGQMTGCESHWAKCEKLRGRVRQEILPLIQEAIAANQHPKYSMPNQLADWQTAALACLRDQTKASMDNLPDTGLPATLEYQLSSVFIEPLDFKGGYGTRASSVLALGSDGYDFIELTHVKPDTLQNTVAQPHHLIRLHH